MIGGSWLLLIPTFLAPLCLPVMQMKQLQTSGDCLVFLTSIMSLKFGITGSFSTFSPLLNFPRWTLHELQVPIGKHLSCTLYSLLMNCCTKAICCSVIILPNPFFLSSGLVLIPQQEQTFFRLSSWSADDLGLVLN